MDTIHEFGNLGCQNQTKVALGNRVFENLQRGKRYSDVDKSYIADLDTIYVIASRDHEKHIFLPLLNTQKCNMYEVERIQSRIEETYKNSTFHLAICDDDSSVLYYTITRGFVDKPENWHKKA